jgi:hypothetical protein
MGGVVLSGGDFIKLNPFRVIIQSLAQSKLFRLIAMKVLRFKNGSWRAFSALGALAICFLIVREIQAQNVVPLNLEDKPLRYSLPDGETTLIIQVPRASMLDTFTFINEATVRGALKIAVANSWLAATDPNWTAVSGDIAFAHKRHFNLSMLGVEAKYVKLFFRVTKEDRIADAAF